MSRYTRQDKEIYVGRVIKGRDCEFKIIAKEKGDSWTLKDLTYTGQYDGIIYGIWTSTIQDIIKENPQ